jgi:hypothetical protein
MTNASHDHQRHKIETLDDAVRWIIEHDARIDVYWGNQHAWNKRVDEKIGLLGSRLTALEKRVVWLTAAAAAIGGALGTGINSLLS